MEGVNVMEEKAMKFGVAHGPSEIYGEALVSHKPISFLGGLNDATGYIIDDHSEINGQCLAGKILVYPFGKGSTGDSQRLWRVCHNGVGPSAIINDTPDPIHIEGAILAKIGIFADLPVKPTEWIHTGDYISIENGVLTIEKRAEDR